MSGLLSLKTVFASRRKNKTYILPNKFGLAFLATVLILLAMAIGSANNLIYLFTFFLASTAFTGMILTNRNLTNVKFDEAQAEDLFANEINEIQLGFSLHNPRVWSVELFFGVKGSPGIKLKSIEHDRTFISLPWRPLQRGQQRGPAVKVESTFPFSMFFAWKTLQVEKTFLVYPERKGSLPLPLDLSQGLQQGETGLFLEHKVYSPGDAVRRVDWRASARSQDLLIKKFEQNNSQTLHLDWDQVQGVVGFEERISQLAAWVDEAEKHGLMYSLSLGVIKIPVARGREHRRFCLSKLAELQERDLR